MSRIQSDTVLIKRIQKYRTPFRDRFFQIVSYFGDEIAFTLGLPILAWNMTRDVSFNVLVAWCLTFYIGHSLKDIFQLPRPFNVDKDVVCLEKHFSAEFGLPSTHSQAVWCIPPTALAGITFSSDAMFWTWVAFALFYASMVSFSRIYLGVHSLLDVVAGALLGILTCMLIVWVGGSLRSFLVLEGNALVCMFFIFLVPVVMLLLYPRLPGFSTTFRDTASILGVTTGVQLADLLVTRLAIVDLAGMQQAPSFSVIALRILLGLICLVVFHEVQKRTVWAIMKAASGQNDDAKLSKSMVFVVVYKYISYIGIGFNTFITVPLLFRKFGLIN